VPLRPVLAGFFAGVRLAVERDDEPPRELLLLAPRARDEVPALPAMPVKVPRGGDGDAHPPPSDSRFALRGTSDGTDAVSGAFAP
jgi:hypothetical protein